MSGDRPIIGPVTHAAHGANRLSMNPGHPAALNLSPLCKSLVQFLHPFPGMAPDRLAMPSPVIESQAKTS